jgi:DNA-binding IclR family transcriptional regulator
MSDVDVQIKAERPTKAKGVRRTIAVLQALAQSNNGVSVMELSRAASIPQSTTSELLNAMVDMGVLVKDSNSRCFRATPLLASLGISAQPEPSRVANLFRKMDALACRTGLTVGLFGILEANLLLYRITDCITDEHSNERSAELCKRGSKIIRNSPPVLLTESAIGHILLSSLGEERARKMIWRIRAQNGNRGDLDYARVHHHVSTGLIHGVCSGASGYNETWDATAILLPSEPEWQSFALAAIYPNSLSLNTDELTETLRQLCSADVEEQSGIGFEQNGPELSFCAEGPQAFAALARRTN